MKRLWYIILHVFILLDAGKECENVRHRQHWSRKSCNFTDFYVEDGVPQKLDDDGSQRPYDDFRNKAHCLSATVFIALGCFHLDSKRGFKRLGYLLLQRFYDVNCFLDPANLKLWEALRGTLDKQNADVRDNVSRIAKEFGQVAEEVVHCGNTVLEKTNQSSNVSDVGNKRYSWVFEFREPRSESNVTVAPLNTLDGYFENAAKKTPSTSEKMRHEWLRYKSFETFPMASPVMPTRLARTGFYYSNCGDEVTCFSCNSTHSNWQEGDIPSDVHATISPSCRHVAGIDHTNVPINAEDTSIEIDGGHGFETGVGQSPMNGSHQQSTNGASAHDSSWVDQARSEVNRSCEPDGGYIPASAGATDHGPSNAVSSTRSAAIPNNPDFSDMTRRIHTLQNWEESEKFAIREIAEMGFFYSTSGACLRCYSCGEGVRDLDTPASLEAVHKVTCQYFTQQGFKGRQTNDSKLEQCSESRSKETFENRTANDTNGSIANGKASDICYQTDGRSPINKLIIDGKFGDGAITKRQPMDLDTQDSIDELTAQLVDMGFEDKQIQRAVSTVHTNGKKITIESVIETIFSEGQNKLKEETDNNVIKPKVKSKVSKKIEKDSAKVQEEYARLKQQITCKICMDNEACMVIMPCGHLASCPTCTCNIRKCPICRRVIRRAIKASI